MENKKNNYAVEWLEIQMKTWGDLPRWKRDDILEEAKKMEKVERLKAQIEVIKEIISSGYKFRNTLEESENKLLKLQQQLKQLEDEQG
jgi:hypothetical protein